MDVRDRDGQGPMLRGRRRAAPGTPRPRDSERPDPAPITEAAFAPEAMWNDHLRTQEKP